MGENDRYHPVVIIGRILEAGGIDPSAVDAGAMKDASERVRQAVVREELTMNEPTSSAFLALLSYLLWKRAVSTAHAAAAVARATKD